MKLKTYFSNASEPTLKNFFWKKIDAVRAAKCCSNFPRLRFSVIEREGIHNMLRKPPRLVVNVF